MVTLAVILAAGGGTRWTAAGGVGHKLLARLPDGRPVLAASIESAIAAGLRVCVVTGSVDVSAVLDAYGPSTREAGPGDGLVVVHNPDWVHGQATSLACAVRWAREHDIDAVLVGLGDQPFLGVEAWRAVASRLALPGKPIVVPTFAGRRGQPVGLRREVWDRLPTNGDAGARILIGTAPDLVDEVACAGEQHVLADIDTPGDLSSWN